MYLKPNAEKKLHWARKMHKELYNAAITNRRTQYERFRHSVSYYEQQNSLPAFKEVWTEYKPSGSQSLQATLKRVDRRYQSFFKGLRGKPKFKKKVKASKRWKKASKKVVLLQRQVANQRQDWIHKVATQIVSGNSLAATEELNLKGMTRKAKKGSKRKAQKTGFNCSILDVGIGSLINAIEYKLQEAGGFLVKVPTKTVKPSQSCPDCGHQRKKDLSERIHHCVARVRAAASLSECGATYDRDVAAARVMLSWALGTSVLNRGCDSFPRNE